MRKMFILFIFVFAGQLMQAQNACLPGGPAVPCDDGNPCTINDSCRNGVCSGTPKLCNDGNACTTDFCDAVSGKCVFVFNTAGCSDGNPCTINDICINGVCTPGTPKACDDGNPCTTDQCDPVSGSCLFTFNTLSCNDGNACTTNDFCINGSCIGGAFRVCNDNNPCTIDACNPQAGCTFIYTGNGTPCDDNNNCTINDECANGLCNGTLSSGQRRVVTSKKDDNSPGSLRSIINSSCANDIITFSVDTVLVNSSIVIPHNLTITGNGTVNTALNGNNSTTIFIIPATVSIGLSNMALINGYASSNGGAFENNGTMFIKDILLKNNYEGRKPKAYGGGGSITVMSAGSLLIVN